MKIESKSMLAKLLATENISVEVNPKLSTAAFDPITRTMFLPKWKEMATATQDLLIGHEVGHAFETPAEGWHDAVCSDRTLKGFLNVIEDARIERKIKARYPGLVRSFYAGYRDLWDRNFFGVKDIDVNTLPLIDRINLHFKVGAYVNARFSNAEQIFVDRCANTDTWEEVEALAREIHGKAQEESEQTIEDLMEQFESTDSDDDSSMDMEGDLSDWEKEESETDSEEDESSGNNGEETDEDFDSDNSDSDTESEDDSDNSDSDTESEDDSEVPEAVQDFVEDGGVGSITDTAFRDNEDKLIDTATTKTHVYVTIPKANLSDFIVSPKDIYNWDLIEVAGAIDPKVYGQQLYSEFISKNNKTINQMVSTFEMKRKASMFVKARTAKTGDLNENRLWAYKTSDDLFKQVTSIPEGKNHGFIMYLDMSGSMNRNMAGTIDQLINLTMFARKIGVPFEVYGFTSDSSGYASSSTVSKFTPIQNEYCMNDLKMPHLLSSTFTKSQIEVAYKYLLLWKQSFVYRYSSDLNRNSGAAGRWVSVYNNQALRMNNTPLNETLIAAIEIAKNFLKASKVEILNTIILTDGEATDGVSYWNNSATEENTYHPKQMRYLETATFKYGSAVYPLIESGNASHNVKLTATLIELYKELTGSKVINYHLVERLNRKSLEYCKEYSKVGNFEFIDWDNIYNTQGAAGIIEVKDKFGFDVRYILDGSKLNIQNEELVVKSDSKSDLLKGFRKFASSKSQQRVFVQKFIPEIA